jgi:tRNA-Thr(GGU) m(6)t(6)A37 methyltransferase TsaA
MTENANDRQETFTMHPIGRINRADGAIQIQVDAPFRPALRQLGQFSHVMVFWWADWFDSDEYRNSQSMLQCEPPYAPGQITGVFATRAPYRPNPIAMTTCKLQGVDDDKGHVLVADIDAVDGTPVVDLKAYFPVCDRVQEATIPSWLSGWPEWMPENGIGLEEGEA